MKYFVKTNISKLQYVWKFIKSDQQLQKVNTYAQLRVPTDKYQAGRVYR